VKRIIFTVYDDLKPQKHTNVDLDISAKLAISEYMERLIDNKKQYAELCNVDFKFFHNTMGDRNLGKTSRAFTNSNLYKHQLMAELAEQYDQVMYVDMDVVFNTTENIFDEIDLSKGIGVKDQDLEIKSKNYDEALSLSFGMRNPTLKYFITKDLLNGKDNHVINTGIVIGNSSDIKKLKFIKRLPNIVKRIAKLKDKSIEDGKLNWIRHFFYSNNESIFSYILEKHNIPYQILDDEWHDIRDDQIVDRSYGKVIHFINKQFHAFFKDKTKVVYSLYIRIEDTNFDDSGSVAGEPNVSKPKRTQQKMDHYYDQLIADKKQYAKSIGAEFIMFERDSMYKDFLKKYSNMSEYDTINLYKIFLLEKLANEYDLILYLDFDVYCRRDIDIFDTIDCTNFLRCNFNTTLDLNINNTLLYFSNYDKDFRHPQSKYWNTHALLTECDLDVSEAQVFNTGIIAASSDMIKSLDFFGNLEDVIKMMTELKEDKASMYPPKIQKVFGYDNETIFAFKIIANNVRFKNLDDKIWHYKHYAGLATSSRTRDKIKLSIREEAYKGAMAEHNPVFVHFISKQLELAYK
jgi:hypothetical protein